MATAEQVWAEMEERGMRTTADDPGYWGIGEAFEIVKAEMERETFEAFQRALKDCFWITGADKIKIANKLHEDYLSGDQQDLPYLNDHLPVFDYKGFCITVHLAEWTFEDDEDRFTCKDLLKGLYHVDYLVNPNVMEG